MRRSLSATLFWLAVLLPPAATGEAGAASPYVVDGIALGASFAPGREYQCSASEQFPEYTWCQRKRQEKAKPGAFGATTSILRSRGGSIAYVEREIRPAFFAGNDIKTEIKRLSTRHGAAARETWLRGRPDLPSAVIAVWGALELEEIDGNSVSTLDTQELASGSVIVDHLGDIARSQELGLPIYRLTGGPGYLWSASSGRDGRGHLRFLAIDPAALAVPTEVADAAATTTASAEAPQRESAPAASRDLRPFLIPQPTSVLPAEAGTQTMPQSGEQSIAVKHRADPEHARAAQAERLAAQERDKARLAWARFEAEKAAYDARDRIKWIVIASLLALIGILALLQMMTRRGIAADASC
jgi:hypothetical protein